MGFALALCGAVAAAAIASAPQGSSWSALATAFAVGGLLILWLVRGTWGGPLASEQGRAGWWLPVAILPLFLPLWTMPVAPGADMAMHAALGRALAQGSGALSPAWGEDVAVALYPRGLSALIALVSPPLGFAKASLLAAAVSYCVVFVGLGAFLQWGVRLSHPFAWAAVALL
ncbi:MAG: hypothetical protein HY901_22995, partial [Deltaproteobacteria bacterium]|nr:hypothetical protein [Deltaproteobacteria bacterium]